MSRLDNCRKDKKPFIVYMISKDKHTLRENLGLQTNHETHQTGIVTEQLTNSAIIGGINMRNRQDKFKKSKLSYTLFAAHTAIKINNAKLLGDIVGILIGFGMTIEEVLDARYGDDSYNLINVAAWNNSLGGLQFCVAKNADINFINKANEDIIQMLDAGCVSLKKMNPYSSKIYESNCTNCKEYIAEVRRYKAQEIIPSTSKPYKFGIKNTAIENVATKDVAIKDVATKDVAINTHVSERQ